MIEEYGFGRATKPNLRRRTWFSMRVNSLLRARRYLMMMGSSAIATTSPHTRIQSSDHSRSCNAGYEIIGVTIIGLPPSKGSFCDLHFSIFNLQWLFAAEL